MAFKRIVFPEEIFSRNKLTSAMIGIGMNFSGRSKSNPNIEDTIWSASHEGMVNGDLRVLSVLVTWLDSFSQWVNADRLVRLVQKSPPPVQAFWSAFSTWKSTDRRFARLKNIYSGKKVDVLPSGSAFLIKKNGEDKRFKGTCLKVPAGTLRDRKQDVISPSKLATKHDVFYSRIQMGPNYRADMWAILKAFPAISASELARRAYGSFATAWEVKSDFQLLFGC